MNALVDGVYDTGVVSPTGALSTTTWLKFEFGSAAIVTGFRSYHQVGGWGGVWSFQGSNDDATYSTLWSGVPFLSTVSLSNLQNYLYYRFISQSGSGADPLLYEIEFFIQTDLCQTSSWSSESSLVCLMLVHESYPKFIDVTVGALVGTGAGVFSFDGTHGDM